LDKYLPEKIDFCFARYIRLKYNPHIKKSACKRTQIKTKRSGNTGFIFPDRYFSYEHISLKKKITVDQMSFDSSIIMRIKG